MATLAVFFAWTYPASQATGNWTSTPADWEQLRIQWEVNALVTLVALLCSIGAALSYPAPEVAAVPRAAPQHAD